MNSNPTVISPRYRHCEDQQGLVQRHPKQSHPKYSELMLNTCPKQTDCFTRRLVRNDVTVCVSNGVPVWVRKYALVSSLTSTTTSTSNVRN